ncbi:MAG: PilW family protein [Pseudomonadota bacterium]
MPALRAACGFTLVELLIALVIALLILAGGSRIFIATGHGYRLQDNLARLQENARYALEALGGELRRTGYLGGITDLARITDTTAAGRARGGGVARDDGRCDGPGWSLQLGYPVFGLDAGYGHYRCLAAGGDARSDILVVRYMAPRALTAATGAAFQPAQWYLRSSVFEGKLFRGAEQAAHAVAGLPVRVAEVVARAYYVRPAPAGGCDGGDTVPSLYRTALAGGRLVASAVVRGVEQLQLQFGIDRDRDGAVDEFVDAPAAGDSGSWLRVLAVRCWLLLRSECPETGYTDASRYRLGNITLTPADGYRRLLVVQTTALRNGGLRP